MSLVADFVAMRDGFRLDFAARVSPGETVAVVGESGAGKTTALRCIAGLLRPRSGRIGFVDESWYDGAARVDVPAYRRNVGMVFQRGALFTHMTVLENVAFGLVAMGASRKQAIRQARETLHTVEAAHLAHKRARDLSGGEAQRVALARAMAPQPSVLLLDEPLTGLDIHIREPVRAALRAAISSARAATIIVTHEPEEAMHFAEQFIILQAGLIVQRGDLGALRAAPATPYVASFFSR